MLSVSNLRCCAARWRISSGTRPLEDRRESTESVMSNPPVRPVLCIAQQFQVVQTHFLTRVTTLPAAPFTHSNRLTMLWYFSMYHRFSLLYRGIAIGRASSVPFAFQTQGHVTEAPVSITR